MDSLKYSINYEKDFRHFDEVDEIILNNYQGSDYIITFIPTLDKDKSKRIILNMSSYRNDISEPIVYINKLRAEGYNIAVKIYMYQEDYIDLLKKAGIPFFFSDFCVNIESAYNQALMGVSDIYVVEELGFRMKDIQYIRKHFPVKIRVIPNIVQAQSGNMGVIESFWIRPEDTELYEPYVDVFEILNWTREEGERTRLSVLFEIYKQRQWLGNLNDIILDFDDIPPVSNRGINPHFGEMRLNCGKRCLIGKCNLCSRTIDLANAFKDAGIELIKPRMKDDLTEEDIEKVKEFLNEHRVDEASNGTSS